MEIVFCFPTHKHTRIQSPGITQHFSVFRLFRWVLAATTISAAAAIATNCCRKRKGATHIHRRASAESRTNIHTQIDTLAQPCLSETETAATSDQRAAAAAVMLLFSCGRFCVLLLPPSLTTLRSPLGCLLVCTTTQATSLSLTISRNARFGQQQKHVSYLKLFFLSFFLSALHVAPLLLLLLCEHKMRSLFTLLLLLLLLKSLSGGWNWRWERRSLSWNSLFRITFDFDVVVVVVVVGDVS